MALEGQGYHFKFCEWAKWNTLFAHFFASIVKVKKKKKKIKNIFFSLSFSSWCKCVFVCDPCWRWRKMRLPLFVSILGIVGAFTIHIKQIYTRIATCTKFGRRLVTTFFTQAVSSSFIYFLVYIWLNQKLKCSSKELKDKKKEKKKK